MKSTKIYAREGLDDWEACIIVIAPGWHVEAAVVCDNGGGALEAEFCVYCGDLSCGGGQSLAKGVEGEDCLDLGV